MRINEEAGVPKGLYELSSTIAQDIVYFNELTDDEISEIEAAIKQIVDSLGTTILTIPGIGYATAASILAEVGDFSNFETPG